MGTVMDCEIGKEKDVGNLSEFVSIKVLAVKGSTVLFELKRKPGAGKTFSPIFARDETPDGRPLSQAICTCATHCANSAHHEPACCNERWCACWCHAPHYRHLREQQAEGGENAA